MNWQERTELLVKSEGKDKLNNANILIVGLGGVGSYAAEQIVRAGIGNITIIDTDIINESNINRQLPALQNTIGKTKTEVVGERLKLINPNLELNSIQEFINEERIPEILLNEKYNYVIDAIDSLAPKVHLLKNCYENNIPIISAMGAGGKMNPEKIHIADISKSYNCKLARMVRKRLHKFNIYKGINVVFSSEKVNEESVILIDNEQNKKSTLGTISYMPAIFGCFCASKVIRDLLQ